jgi:hypothetical protein
MEIGKLSFKLDQRMVRAGDVTGAPAPVPMRAEVSTIAPITFGCCDIPR